MVKLNKYKYPIIRLLYIHLKISLNKANILDSYKDSKDYLNLLLSSQGSKSNYELQSIPRNPY